MTDFSNRFEKYIFLAIKGLYEDGASAITPIDISNYLESNATAKKLFEASNGVEYIQDVIEFSQVENFNYYYQKLKKLNLLNDLKKQGINTDEFYCEDLTNPNADKINSVFEDLSTADIINGVKKKLLKLESDYGTCEEVETQSIADGIDDLLDNLETSPEVGKPIQGDIYNQIIDGAQRGTLTIRSSGSGIGKALPNSTVIPTPIGWRKVEDIKSGDYLFDALGKPTQVLGVYPQGKKEVYQLTFKDGRTAKCSEDHLWSYRKCTQLDKHREERLFNISSVKELLKEDLKTKNGDGWRILMPMQYAVEYPEKKHYLSPYLFGLALGDGSFRQHESNKSFQFSSETEELPNAFKKEMNWIVKKNSDFNYTWYFATKEKQTNGEKINVWVEDVLKEYPELVDATSHTKFIPRDYLEDSIENRFSLLQGLLDTDGSVDDKGRVNFFTVSESLKDNVVELGQSLGFKIVVSVDTHKEKTLCYIVNIQGRPEDKIKLFRLKRKAEKIQNWYNNGKRKEKNDFNPLVSIQNLHYEEEMTCFLVDNPEHMFLTESFIPTHNTRNSVADACYLAFPLRYNQLEDCWEKIGGNEKVLFIITEQTFKQIRKMILAYLTGINESKFKYGRFTNHEWKIINQARQIIKDFADNFIIIKMPNPTIELVKLMVRENVLTKNIGYVFYDYIFIGPSLLNEFKGFSLRNDELLLMLATALKDLAVELDVCVMTSTQVNAQADDNRHIRNEASLAGGRATINKADNGAIMARPTKEELSAMSSAVSEFGEPNLVTDIFKVRSGEWTQVRIWSQIDLGTLRKKDLFITDERLEPIQDFFVRADYEIDDWSDETTNRIKTYIKELNDGL